MRSTSIRITGRCRYGRGNSFARVSVPSWHPRYSYEWADVENAEAVVVVDDAAGLEAPSELFVLR
jgi:hypothetical protein